MKKLALFLFCFLFSFNANAGITSNTKGVTFTTIDRVGDLTFVPAVGTNLLSLVGNINNYSQLIIQNKSNGASASTDFIVGGDAQTDSAYYMDMGCNSSGYSVGTWTINGASDCYLYAQTKGIAFGTAAASQDIKFFSGGTLVANETARVSDAAKSMVISGTESLIGIKKTADFNSTADQTIPIVLPGRTAKYLVTRILVTNPSTSLTTSVGGFYTAASKGGTAIVANTQVYTAASAATKVQNVTIAAAGSADTRAETTLYFALTTGQGVAATADIYLFGIPLP